MTDILTQSNLDILKCFKDVFKLNFILKCIGGLIIIGIIFFEIIFSLTFLLYEINKIMQYLYCLTELYIDLYDKQNQEIKNIKMPPKKRERNKAKIKAKIKVLKTTKNDDNSHRSKNSLKSDRLFINQKSKSKLNLLKDSNKNKSFKAKTILINYKGKNNKNIKFSKEAYITYMKINIIL